MRAEQEIRGQIAYWKARLDKLSGGEIETAKEIQGVIDALSWVVGDLEKL